MGFLQAIRRRRTLEVFAGLLGDDVKAEASAGVSTYTLKDGLTAEVFRKDGSAL